MSPKSPLAIDYSLKGEEYREQQRKLKEEKPLTAKHIGQIGGPTLSHAIWNLLESAKKQAQ